MCFVKVSNEKKAQLFIYYKYFAVLYGSLVIILKQFQVISNKNQRNNHCKIIVTT